MPVTYYTEEEFYFLHRVASVAAGSFLDIERYFEKLDRKNRKYRNEHYNFIPLNTNDFIRTLIKVYDLFKTKSDNYPNPSFLDVGCGPGTKLLLASHIGFHVKGIEYDKDLVDMSKLLFSDDFIFNQDAFTFEGYSSFDVIYYYCPINDHNKEQKLERLIEDKMKVGAYLVAFLKSSDEIKKDKRFKVVLSPDKDSTRIEVYKKINDLSLLL